MFWKEILKFFASTDSKKDVIVHLAVYNLKAIEFYKKLGFVDTGKRFSEEAYKMPISGVIVPEMEMILKLAE